MEVVTVRHWLKCPVRYQAWFAGKDLEECKEEHSLFTLPGPSVAGLKLGREGAATGERLGACFPVSTGSQMDQHGLFSGSFTRQYKLPDGLQVRGLSAVLCHGGILVMETRP
ncbi:heat shock protein beta-3-like [Polyodon spathula]|uniref:heat shock protein beta-3-like n=1 Tax=Polyodon spathula TaxID=7913 RepID=UPI001B7D91BE|nr:heat shock protein beta-3-like [Polyodon spathula]